MPKSAAELFAKEQQKELNKRFIELCKQKDGSLLLADIDNCLSEGAVISASGCKAMYLAVKNHNFELIDYLIDHGILENPLARGYLASMCDFGEFGKYESKYFERLDKAISLTGFSPDYLIPYINCSFVHGEQDKALVLSDKYPISRTNIVECVHVRIIFEMIDKDLVDGLAIINGYRDWIDQKTFGVAVSSGNVKVIEYMLARKRLVPPISSVCDAIFQGYRSALDLLDIAPNPLYRRNAESSKDEGMLEYLENRGLI